jgi:ABC-2 type transport system permease protein
MNSFKALVKREYWENKGSIFVTPAVIAAVLAGIIILVAITGDTFVQKHHSEFSVWEKFPQAVEEFNNIDEETRTQAVQVGLYTPRILFGFVMFIIALFYCLGSLYDERKDKSILFWKSLPVSDTATVLSKFATVCLMIPIVYCAVVAAFQLFLLVFATILAWFGGSLGVAIWTSSNLFGVLFNSLFSFVVATLWLAPLWAWFMFASAWAKKVAFLWGTLPIFMMAIAEVWIFRSSNFIEMVAERVGRGFMTMNSDMQLLVGRDMFDEHHVARWYEVLGQSDFWIGLIVAAGFLAGAIYTRRYRDES